MNTTLIGINLIISLFTIILLAKSTIIDKSGIKVPLNDNDNLLYCKIRINKESYKLIVDSASTENVISYDFIKDKFLEGQEVEKVNYMGIDGIQHESIRIDIPFIMSGRHYKEKFMVNQQQTFEMLGENTIGIIGMPFLKKYEGKIIIKNNQLILKKQKNETNNQN